MEKVIDVKVNIEQAKKNFNDVNESIKLQEKFVSDLRLKVAELEFEMSNMNGTQKMMAEQTLTKFNAELKVEAAALRALKVEASQYNKVLKTQSTRTQVGRVKALEFNESLLKNRDIQAGLNQITGGLSGQIVKFGKLFVSASKGIKVAGIALNGFKKALIATGIGGIVVLVALLVSNFDKLKDAVNGVSRAQKDNLDTAKDTVAEEQSKLDVINSQDETLRRQGKSEKDILRLKIAQTNETIEALKVQLEQEKQIKASQVAAAERNQKILAGIIGVLTAPVTMILAAIDAATYAASLLGLTDATSLAEDFTMGAASFFFDPQEVADEGDAVIEETEKKLRQLTNTRDGYLNRIDDMNEKSANKTKKNNDDELREEENKQKQIIALRERYEKLNEDREDETFLQKALRQKERALAELEALGEDLEAKAELEKYYDDLIAEAKIKDQNIITKTIEEEEAKRMALRNQAFDDAVRLAGEESRLGKAILLAKTILSAKENFLRIKDSVLNAQKGATDATVDGTKAGSNIASGFSETLKLGFPKAVPFLIAYAAQAASVISAIKSAVGKTKEVAGSIGGGTSIGSSLDAPAITRQAPSFNIVGASAENQLAQTIADQTEQPVQAFVVANDVTTAQGLERNIIQESSLG